MLSAGLMVPGGWRLWRWRRRHDGGGGKVTEAVPQGGCHFSVAFLQDAFGEGFPSEFAPEGSREILTTASVQVRMKWRLFSDSRLPRTVE